MTEPLLNGSGELTKEKGTLSSSLIPMDRTADEAVPCVWKGKGALKLRRSMWTCVLLLVGCETGQSADQRFDLDARYRDVTFVDAAMNIDDTGVNLREMRDAEQRLDIMKQ